MDLQKPCRSTRIQNIQKNIKTYKSQEPMFHVKHWLLVLTVLRVLVKDHVEQSIDTFTCSALFRDAP